MMRSELQTLPEENKSLIYTHERPLTIKQLLKVINLLKAQGYEVIKAKFGLSSDRLRTKLSNMIDYEENDVFYKENGKKENTSTIETAKQRENREFRKGCLFPIGSHLRSEIFLEAYRSKIDELEKSSQVKIKKLEDDLFIESEIAVRPESIVFSEMMDMYKGLKIFVFYNEPEICDALASSIEFAQKLERKGIFCKNRKSKKKNVAFYSKTFLAEEIRKEVLKEKPVQPQILKLYYENILEKENQILFGLFSRSIEPLIAYLKQIHELQIEINPKIYSLILYTSHQSFTSAPLVELSSAFSNMFLLSFTLQNSRQFTNMIKRSVKFYPFIKVIRWKSMVYCFIDSLKIGGKKNLLDTFFCFLGELNNKTKIKFYIKHNSQIQKSHAIANKILTCAQTNNLIVSNQEKVFKDETLVISIKCKYYSTEEKRKKRQFEFCSFLVNTLIPDGQDNKIKLEEIKDYFKENKIYTFGMNEVQSFEKVSPFEKLNSKQTKRIQQEIDQSSDSDLLIEEESEDEQNSEVMILTSTVSKF